MQPTRRTFAVLTIALTLPAAVHADQINVDFDDGNGAPPSDYGAAGAAGFWNAIDVANPADPLLDTLGRETGVTLSIVGEPGNIGFTETPHQDTEGSDALLLRDYSYSSATGIRVRFAGLTPGQYIVTTYSVGRQDLHGGRLIWMNDDFDGAQVVEGLWDGGFEQGLTHASHVVLIDEGVLDVHARDGGDPFINGIQISPIPAPGAGSLLLALAAVRRRRAR